MAGCGPTVKKRNRATNDSTAILRNEPDLQLSVYISIGWGASKNGRGLRSNGVHHHTEHADPRAELRRLLRAEPGPGTRPHDTNRRKAIFYEANPNHPYVKLYQ